MNSTCDKTVDGDALAIRWDIDLVVAQLRSAREQNCEPLDVARTVRLPSQKALIGILDGLVAALFPNRADLPDLTAEGVDFFVGNTLDLALRELHEQVGRELAASFSGCAERSISRAAARDITQEFASRLPEVRQLLESDLRAAFQGDPAARSVSEILLCYPGIIAVTHHRLAHVLYGLGAPLLARMIAEIAHSTTGIDIHPGARIGASFFIDHGTGVVIGESAIIGERVRLYQAVTLGAKRFPTDETGAILKGNERHPIVEDDVVVYAGATILGRITIGKGSVIGGNVWLTRSVPPGSNITQAKNRSEAFDDGGGI